MKTFLTVLAMIVLFLIMLILGLFVFEAEQQVWQYLVSLWRSQREKLPAFLMGGVYLLLYLIPFFQNIRIKKELKRESEKDFFYKAALKINFIFFLVIFAGYNLFSFGSFNLLKENQPVGMVFIALAIITFFVYIFSANKVVFYLKHKQALSR
ncbi:MAG: hypothetical protein K9M44_01675 [Candidatus Pacebacteria bacterium]|nr:hypothetical protein [Candidatus Paceibacterota bacterium]